tara:strand:- start:109 stop:258 length:150 start_codon:yes stop_codon:yes gene_type:complete
MTKKTTTIGSDTWEWEETPEVKEAIKKLHSNSKIISELELKAPDYGVGK